MANVQKIGEGRDAKYRVKYRTLSGQGRSKTFDRKIDADRFGDSIETDKIRGTFSDPTRGRIRFGDWVTHWLSLPHNTRPSTRARDESYIQNQILPHFARYRLADITRAEVQQWVHLLQSTPRSDTKGPLAAATIHKAHQILAKILEAAVIAERLATNPARSVQLPKNLDKEARFLTPSELLSLESAMPERIAVLIPFIADVGLRIGEAAGLRWRNVDSWKGSVTVDEVLVEVHGKVLFGPPKTQAGKRIVPTLTREIAERLEAIRGKPGDLVFTSPNGGALRPNAFRKRVWAPAVGSADLAEPLPTPHALRHAAVAHWIAAGIEPYKLAKWAGHRSVATIYRLYGHLLDNDASSERDALSAIRAAAVFEQRQRGEVVAMHARIG